MEWGWSLEQNKQGSRIDTFSYNYYQHTYFMWVRQENAASEKTC